MISKVGPGRVERFAARLDELEVPAAPAQREPTADRRVARLVDVAQALRALRPEPPIDPAFRAELRRRLLAVAAEPAAPPRPVPVAAPKPVSKPVSKPVRKRGSKPVPRWAWHWRTRHAVALGGVFVMVVALTVVGLASRYALPGDPLYGMKRSIESAQLKLSTDVLTQGERSLDFADSRLAEASAVSADPARVRVALAAMNHEIETATRLLTELAVHQRDQRPLRVLDAFVARQQPKLTKLARHLSGSTRSLAAGSLKLLDGVDKRSDQLRAVLQCTSARAASMVHDAYGPMPGTCQTPGSGAGGGPGPAVASPSPSPSASSPAAVPTTPPAPGTAPPTASSPAGTPTTEPGSSSSPSSSAEPPTQSSAPTSPAPAAAESAGHP